MNATTLRGVFPDPKPVHRKNFLKENIKEIKRMQTILQDVKAQSQSRRDKTTKIAPLKIPSAGVISRGKRISKPGSSSKSNNDHFSESKYTDRSVQTEFSMDVNKSYEIGAIKNIRKSPDGLKKKQLEQGDNFVNSLKDNLQKLVIDEKASFVKDNKKNFKSKNKKDETTDTTLPPANYRKGIPKKNPNLKDEGSKYLDSSDDPYPGHILLPDHERKEYLRVSRQSYADLIKELNSMPIKNDTLKMRKRKMQIEEELKKIDEAIKVFQKPKVFVKSDM